MDPILATIDEALARKRLSDAAASKLAVGHPALIKNLRMPREGEKRYNLPSLQKLAEVLGLEFYFGPKRELGQIEVIDRDELYAHIPVYDASLSAGPGSINGSEEIVDALAFRRDWLIKVGIDAARAVIARASGDSMQPCISDGDLLLIDRSKTTPPPPRSKTERASRAPIFALIHNGEAKVKRVQLVDAEHAILLSDNPDHSPVITNPDTLSIIGKVVWWGHTNRD
jgi:phage repressor protein C with HTH and peptisase S24 domain